MMYRFRIEFAEYGGYESYEFKEFSSDMEARVYAHSFFARVPIPQQIWISAPKDGTDTKCWEYVTCVNL